MKTWPCPAADRHPGCCWRGCGWYFLPPSPGAQQEAEADQGHRRRRGRRGGGTDADPIPRADRYRPHRRRSKSTSTRWARVQAFNTVSIKAMIDGPMTQVAFTEGQGRACRRSARPHRSPARIRRPSTRRWPRRRRMMATLANARLDLARYQKLVANAYTSRPDRRHAEGDGGADRGDREAGRRAAIETARTNLSLTPPSSARWMAARGIRQVDQGNIVHASDTTPLTVITQLQPISVVFQPAAADPACRRRAR